MLKFGSACSAMPSNVKNVRMSKMMYGGVRNLKLALSLAKPVARAPNRLCPPSSADNVFATAAVISSSVAGSYPAPRVSRFKNPSAGVNPTSWNTNTKPSQFPEIMCWIPLANPSMILGSTSLINPKSKNTNMSSLSSIMFPSCGSACTNPV